MNSQTAAGMPRYVVRCMRSSPYPGSFPAPMDRSRSSFQRWSWSDAARSPRLTRRPARPSGPVYARSLSAVSAGRQPSGTGTERPDSFSSSKW
ncbi:hypothetical protein [Streptomyces sp. NPDC048845]|uniref:hypothetical protein n=1 Tax=Streptomyces sp. NPDC048845 TaxID=3155390 RepID=UPI00344067B3